jgi:hypothetical protein
MKTKNIIISLLVVIIVWLATTMAYQLKVQNATDRADDLALSLSQINELIDSRNPMVAQINEILSNNGYQYLKRKVINKVEEESNE